MFLQQRRQQNCDFTTFTLKVSTKVRFYTTGANKECFYAESVKSRCDFKAESIQKPVFLCQKRFWGIKPVFEPKKQHFLANKLFFATKLRFYVNKRLFQMKDWVSGYETAFAPKTRSLIVTNNICTQKNGSFA